VRFGTVSPPPVVAASATANSFVVTVVPATKYYWRITGKNKPGASTGQRGPSPRTPPPPPPPSGLPVVPGAYGYGMQTRAAYGCSTTPAVLTVTNLNDSGAGSLRAAVEATMPRVVVFEVGGYVDLLDMIRVQSPCLTVAGQTAPSPGITLRKFGVEIISHDVLLQHFRIRPGEWGTYFQSNCGIMAYGGNTHDIVLDHMSVSWGPDENIAADTYYNGAMNMTVWRSISAEGLDYPASVNYSASHGVLVMPQSFNVALIQSLVMTNRERNPYQQSDTSLAAINNVIYNAFANWWFFYANYDLSGNPSAGGPLYASDVGNRLIAGANTDDDQSYAQGTAFYFDKPGTAEIKGNQVYRSDNTVDSAAIAKFVDMENELSYSPFVTSPPARASLSTFPAPMASTTVEAFVAAHAGARPLDRDDVDKRLISDLATRTARGYRNHQDLYGGYPVMPSTRLATTIPANPHVVAASGYTNLEDWLHGLAAVVGE
jgi:hypothetical protein